MIEVDAQELRREHAARQFWETARPALLSGDAPDLIALSRDSDAADLALAVSDYGPSLREAIRSGLADDARDLDFITRLREMAAGDPDDGQTSAAQARLDLMQTADLHQAAVTQAILMTVAAAFERADLIALTNWAAELNRLNPGGPQIQEQPVQMPQVQIPLLSHGGAARAHTHGAQRGKFPPADGSEGTSAPEPGPESNPPGLAGAAPATDPPTKPGKSERRSRNVKARRRRRAAGRRR